MKLFLLVLIYGIALTQSCPSACGDGVTEKDEQTITAKHNQIRLRCAKGQIPGQPRGCNLKKMKYDRALGAKAQEIAETCQFEHVPVNDGRWHHVGQNLYMAWQSNKPKNNNWNGAIDGWYNEYKVYHYPNNPGQDTGHYTQLVWHDTEYVGCGYKCFKEGGWYKQLYVCNYGPGGNIIGNPPYETDSNGVCKCPNLC